MFDGLTSLIKIIRVTITNANSSTLPSLIKYLNRFNVSVHNGSQNLRHYDVQIFS